MVRRFFEHSESGSGISDIRYGSHSHDSIDVEQHNGKSMIVQRNGVQGLKDSEMFALPGALGTESYLMINSKNEEAFCSSNHGVGRILDKHIATKAFSNKETEEKLSRKGIKIFRVGSGKISEQDPDAFKDVSIVVAEMESQGLGTKFAKLSPVCSLKG